MKKNIILLLTVMCIYITKAQTNDSLKISIIKAEFYSDTSYVNGHNMILALRLENTDKLNKYDITFYDQSNSIVKTQPSYNLKKTNRGYAYLDNNSGGKISVLNNEITDYINFSNNIFLAVKRVEITYLDTTNFSKTISSEIIKP